MTAFEEPAKPAGADPTKAKVVKEFVHNAPLIACRFDPAGKYVFAGTEDRLAVAWDLATGSKVAYAGHESWVQTLVVAPDGKTLVTGGCDGAVKWWTIRGYKPALRLQDQIANRFAAPFRSELAHRYWVRSAALSPDGALLATCGTDKTVKLWSIGEGKLLRELKGHEKDVYRVLFHPSGQLLISGDLKGDIRHWEIATGRELRTLNANKLWHFDGGQQVDYGGARDLAFSADAKLLAASGLIEASNPLGAVSNPAIVLFDWPSGKEKLLLRPKENLLGVAWSVRFHPSGFLIMAVGGNAGGHLLFFKPDQANEFHKFSLPNTVLDMDLHPDGMRIATAHHDGRLRITAMG